MISQSYIILYLFLGVDTVHIPYSGYSIGNWRFETKIIKDNTSDSITECIIILCTVYCVSIINYEQFTFDNVL